MCQKNDLPLSLKSDTFNAMCSDCDQIIRSTLQGMEETEQDTAEINVKIKITLTPDSAPDFEVRDHTRAITKPKFDHTVSAVIQRKEKKSGSLSGNYELVWDKETCQYVMRPIDNGQVSMFDNGNQSPSKSGEVIEAEFSEVPALEGRKVLGLTDGAEDAPGGGKDVLGYDKLKEYVGKEVCCDWAEDEKAHVIRCLDDDAVILDAADCPDAELEKHVGHDILCVSFEQDGQLMVAIICDTCDCALYTVSQPVVEKPESPYDYLLRFAGEDLICLEAMGIITIRTGNQIIISSAAPSGAMLGDEGKKKLMAHVGHHLCISTGVRAEGGDFLALECPDCEETITEVDRINNPDKAEGEYPYEEPGEEGEAV